ncbi:hypothetical protein D9M68_946410 [compost metagenome]
MGKSSGVSPGCFPIAFGPIFTHITEPLDFIQAMVFGGFAGAVRAQPLQGVPSKSIAGMARSYDQQEYT